MQSAEDRPRTKPPRPARVGVGRVFGQRQVCSGAVAVMRVERSTQRNDDLRTRSHDQGTRVASSRSIVPRDRSAMPISELSVLSQIAIAKGASECLAVDPVPVTNKILWRALPTTCLRDLLGDPNRQRVRSDAEPEDAPSIVSEDQQPVQDSDEIVGTTNRSSRRSVGMIEQEGSPAL
jgi:hypothetical protein